MPKVKTPLHKYVAKLLIDRGMSGTKFCSEYYKLGKANFSQQLTGKRFVTDDLAKKLTNFLPTSQQQRRELQVLINEHNDVIAKRLLLLEDSFKLTTEQLVLIIRLTGVLPKLPAVAVTDLEDLINKLEVRYARNKR